MAALLALALLGTPAAASAATLDGQVLTGKTPLAGYEVTLYRGGKDGTAELASGRSEGDGTFSLGYRAPRSGVQYLIAQRPGDPAVRLAAVLGQSPPASVTLNERTTVATGAAMAQFTDGVRISGPSPGLANAAGMARNLVKLGTGAPSRVLSTFPNGRSTTALRTFNSMSNMLAGCVRARAACRRLFALTTPPGGAPPNSTLQAIVNLTHNPSVNRLPLLKLSRRDSVYEPSRMRRPSAWILALRFDGDGRTMSGPGNFAIDAKGSVWATNNFDYARPRSTPVCGSDLLLRFTPRGRFFKGSPYRGGGVNGAGYGITLDPDGDVWVGNFGFSAPVPGCPADQQPPSNSISQFSGAGAALSPAVTGWTAGGVSWPQGTVSDRGGNIWVANCGNDSVTRSPAGDPSGAVNLSGLGLVKPFDVAIGRRGTVFVSGVGNSAVAVLANDGSVGRVVTGGGLRRPMGVATDSKGNLWVANSGLIDVPCPPPAQPSGNGLGGSVTLIDAAGVPRRKAFTGGGLTVPWGIAVDGDDNVWVANFAGRRISLFCGRTPKNCPPGKRTGDAISPNATGYGFKGLRRITAVEIDPSGNAWLTNNYKLEPCADVNGACVLQNPGGYEVVVYVGVAGPVKTPLIGPVRTP